MIEEQGTVVSVMGDYAEVRPERRESCGACSASGACGTSLLDRFFGRRPVRLRARNQAAAQVGDRVILGVSEQGLVTAALAAYLVPILGLVIGAALGQSVGREYSDLWSLFGGFVGFSLALFWLRGYSARLALDPERQPIVLRRIAKPPSSVPVSVPLLRD